MGLLSGAGEKCTLSISCIRLKLHVVVKKANRPRGTVGIGNINRNNSCTIH